MLCVRISSIKNGFVLFIITFVILNDLQQCSVYICREEIPFYNAFLLYQFT